MAKAKKLYPGHYQPKIPADLGFYDLRLPEVREQQAEMAREAGIEGFCYYHYWFEDGKEELDRPFKEVLASRRPDFPFCLCWANETWGNKMWNKDGSVASQKILVEQKYLGKEDNEKHFYSLLEAFKDERYIKVDGKLLFMIYRPLIFKGLDEFMHQWNSLAKYNNLPGFFFVGQCVEESDIKKCLELGLDAVNLCKLYPGNPSLINKFVRRVMGLPRVISYKKMVKRFDSEQYKDERVFPTLIPNWDHSPRSGRKGMIFHGSTPALFEKHVFRVICSMADKRNKVIFLKSWNEWGEGNYVEPDARYGHGYLDVIKKNLE